MDNNISQEGFKTLDDYKENNQDEQLTLFSLQELAVKTTDTLDKLQADLKTINEMYLEVFNNDASYKEEKGKVTELSKQLKSIKASIAGQPEVISLANKMREIKNEIKEKKLSVSDYAMEVFRKTGNNEFETNGETFEIKTVAKLVKRKQ